MTLTEEKSVAPEGLESEPGKLTPGQLRLPIELAVEITVVPKFMAGMVLTMIGFPSNPCGAPNKGDTMEVLIRLLKIPAKDVTISICA